MTLHNGNLITSDWHVLHQNIYWQLPEIRSILTGNQHFKPSSIEEFYQAENAIYTNILNELKETNQVNPITRFIHLGDFCVLKGKNKLSPLETIEKYIPTVPSIFNYLKSHKIPSILVLGNHDQPDRKHGREVLQLFDEVIDVLWEENCIYTHYPLGYSIAKDLSFNTPEQFLFGMPKQFSKLDKRLLSEWDGRKLLNFHGHIHQLNFSKPLHNVEYRNMCIDYDPTSADKSR